MDLSKLSPNNQKQLHSYHDVFTKLTQLYEKNILPNKILLSGKKGLGKATFAYHFINYIFSKNEEFSYDSNLFKINNLNKSYNLILNNIHPNFYCINLALEKKNIEISQIREMITYANKSSFNSKEKIILIDNVEYLNLNSLNALLKIVEEPNANIIFILIFNNEKKILKTLTSRCLKFNFSLSYHESLNITNKILNENIHTTVNPPQIKFLVNLINFSKITGIDLKKINLKNFIINMIDDKIYKKNDFVKKNIYKFIELYFLNIISSNEQKKNINLLYENFIYKFNELKKFNLDEESFFIEFKTKILNE